MVTTAAACAGLALVILVAPGSPAPARLSGLRSRRIRRGRRGLPVAAAAGLGALLGFLLAGPAGALSGAAVAARWRHRYARARVERAAAALSVELADALGRITEELRAGAHPAAALAGTEADGHHARSALAPAARAAALGDGVPAALARGAAGRPEVARALRRTADAWALAERHGVPLAEVLAGVHRDLRWRVAYAEKVRAGLAGPRATAAVLLALPGLGLALGQLVGAEPLAVLRSGAVGQALVVVGVGLAAAGTAWTRRILTAAVPR